MENIRGANNNSTSQVHTGDACRRGRDTISFQRQDHLHVNVQRRELVAKSEMKNMSRQNCDTGGVVCQRLQTRIPRTKGRRKIVELESNSTTETLMQEFSQSGHRVFGCSSPLSRGVLQSQGGRRSSILNNADPSSVETLFKTIVPVIQISI